MRDPTLPAGATAAAAVLLVAACATPVHAQQFPNERTAKEGQTETRIVSVEAGGTSLPISIELAEPSRVLFFRLIPGEPVRPLVKMKPGSVELLDPGEHTVFANNQYLADSGPCLEEAQARCRFSGGTSSGPQHLVMLASSEPVRWKRLRNAVSSHPEVHRGSAGLRAGEPNLTARNLARLAFDDLEAVTISICTLGHEWLAGRAGSYNCSG